MGSTHRNPSAEWEIVLLERKKGRTFYTTRHLRTGRTSFQGTKGQCHRYLQILNEKLRRQFLRRRVERSLGIPVYRVMTPGS
jgi:hypothetical protein